MLLLNYLLLNDNATPAATQDYLHECLCAVEQAEFIVQERLSRLPLKMHAPEKILCQAHGQARPIADFLHENGDIFI